MNDNDLKKNMLKKYEALIIENIIISLARNKVRVKQDAYLAIPLETATKYNNLKELEYHIINNAKKTLPCIFEKGCIQIIDNFSYIFSVVADLPLRERLIFQLSLMQFHERTIAHEFRTTIKEIKQTKKIVEKRIYDNLPARVIPCFNSLLAISGYIKAKKETYFRFDRFYVSKRLFISFANYNRN